jgi:hypothetical protein
MPEPQKPNNPPAKPSVDKTSEIEPAQETPKFVIKPVDVRYKQTLTSLIADVAGGAKLSEAKQLLYEWVDELDEKDKASLLQTITSLSKRVKDIAEALTSEAPSLVAKLQQ